MKDFRLIILVTAILVAGSAGKSLAQALQEETSPAGNAYRIKSKPTKLASKKKQKAHKRQQARAMREKELANRKRNNWAG